MMRAICLLVFVMSFTANLTAQQTAEELLSQAIKDADAGRYDRFLQKVEQSLRLTWVIYVPTPEENTKKEKVRIGYLREVARRFGSAPQNHREQAQQLAWRFFEKAVQAPWGHDPFIELASWYACWEVMKPLLKDAPAHRERWEAIERHFVEYRQNVERLRKRYGQEIPDHEFEKLGNKMLDELRRIVKGDSQ